MSYKTFDNCVDCSKESKGYKRCWQCKTKYEETAKNCKDCHKILQNQAFDKCFGCNTKRNLKVVEKRKTPEEIDQQSDHTTHFT